MIENQTNGRFEEILEHVYTKNDKQLNETFIRCLAMLARKADDVGKIVLYADFASLSMTWTLFNQDGKAVMNGGFIYHPKPGERMEDNFTTHLDDRFYGFSIHT